MNSFNLQLQLKDTESEIRNKLIALLTEFKGFKFVTTSVLKFKKKYRDNETKYGTFYSTETVINDKDFDDASESMFNTIISNI